VKLAISGKGGVGKTTLAALLAHGFARAGHRVVAVDADPDANLGHALGFPREEVASLVPVAHRSDILAERSGARGAGQFFSLNPRVDDLPERFWLERDGIRLLVMGTVSQGGAGCACPENTVLSRLIQHLVMARDDVVILDMEAGLEHLGRGTARAVDAFVVVVEPGQRSIQTAHSVVRLASDLGIRRVYTVANKVRPQDAGSLHRALSGLELIGQLPYDEEAIAADLAGWPVTAIPALVAGAEKIRARLSELVAERE
jgi:CO dehydrogenase maturation factor